MAAAGAPLGEKAPKPQKVKNPTSTPNKLRGNDVGFFYQFLGFRHLFFLYREDPTPRPPEGGSEEAFRAGYFIFNL